MIDFKPCKGQSRAIGFNGCGNMTDVKIRKYGLCKDCYTQWLISDDLMAKKTFDSFLLKNKKDYEKKKRIESKKQKEELIDYKPKLQDKINEIVRLIDIGLPCLAKGIHASQIHAGHVFARGGNQSMRYNTHNIHRQSAQSNHYQNDDGLLREGLINEYGIAYFDFVAALRKTPQLKYANHEYKSFFKHASSIANELKKQGRIFPTIEERIFMRNEINNQLGIYDQEYCEFKK